MYASKQVCLFCLFVCLLDLDLLAAIHHTNDMVEQIRTTTGARDTKQGLHAHAHDVVMTIANETKPAVLREGVT